MPEQTISPEQVHRLISIPPEDRITSIDYTSASYLYQLMQKHEVKNSLEIGFGWGYASAFMLAGGVDRHIVIEKSSDRLDRAVSNVEKIPNAKSRLTLILKSSDLALPALVDKGETFDFAFIDGGHRFDDVFIDLHYCSQLVRDGRQGGPKFDNTDLVGPNAARLSRHADCSVLILRDRGVPARLRLSRTGREAPLSKSCLARSCAEMQY